MDALPYCESPCARQAEIFILLPPGSADATGHEALVNTTHVFLLYDRPSAQLPFSGHLADKWLATAWNRRGYVVPLARRPDVIESIRELKVPGVPRS